jgi:hypothetical protein
LVSPFTILQVMKHPPDAVDPPGEASSNGYLKLQHTFTIWRFGLRENWPQLEKMLSRAKVDNFYVACKDDEKHLTYLQKKFDVSQSIKNGDAIIHTLISSAVDDEQEGARLLKKVLAMGVDPERKNFEGERPSHVAGDCGLVEIATVLSKCRVDMCAVDRNGKTSIAVAKAAADEEGWVRNECNQSWLNRFISVPLQSMQSSLFHPRS